MFGFRSQFDGPLLTAAAVAVVLAAALVVASRWRSGGRRGVNAAARALATGAGLVIVVATAAPSTWPPTLTGDGDLVLRPGRGGLDDWRILFDQPDSLAAVLLIANVLLYIPLGFFACLGWNRALPVLAAAASLSAAIEAVQWQALGRVGSIDDVLLNVSGAVVGVMLAGGSRRTRPWTSFGRIRRGR